MKGLAREGDPIVGGPHCHGHNHGPQPSPGTIVTGSRKVFADGRRVARNGDRGHSPACCGGIGTITIQAKPGKVFVDGQPVALAGTTTIHCEMASGYIREGSRKVVVGG